MKQLLSLLLLLTTVNLVALDQHTVEHYLVDPELQAILDEHTDELYHHIERVHHKKKKHGVWQFDWLPGYYVKYGLARITGMEKMNKCIERYNLDLLTVPDKKLYHIKGRPTTLSNKNYAVIIKKVERPSVKIPLTKEQVAQLITIIKKTHYISMTTANYIYSTDGLIYLIDTESTYDAHQLSLGFHRLVTGRPNLNTHYTQEALEYVFDELYAQLKKCSPDKQREALSAVRAALKRQEAPYSWDYFSYAKNLFNL